MKSSRNEEIEAYSLRVECPTCGAIVTECRIGFCNDETADEEIICMGSAWDWNDGELQLQCPNCGTNPIPGPRITHHEVDFREDGGIRVAPTSLESNDATTLEAVASTLSRFTETAPQTGPVRVVGGRGMWRSAVFPEGTAQQNDTLGIGISLLVRIGGATEPGNEAPATRKLSAVAARPTTKQLLPS